MMPHMLPTMLENDATRYHLIDAQVRQLELAMTEVRGGMIASDPEMRALWSNFGA